MVTQTSIPMEDDMLSAEELQYAPLESKLHEWGLTYRVDRGFPVDQININPDAQVRLAAHIAPPPRVEEYTYQMRNGAMFPPLLLRNPGNILIDGNTRLAAAKRCNRKTIPVLIVDTQNEDIARMLAASINQMGGERLTAQEAHETALVMIRNNYPDSAIARELGRDQSQVRRWRAQRDVLARAETLGLGDLEATMSRTVAGTLGEIRLEQPFIEAAKLFKEVPLKEKEARDFVTEIVQAPSEEAAVKVVQEKRNELAPAGPPPRRPSKEIGLAHAAIGNLIKFEGRPSAAFDVTKKKEELALWERVHRVTGEVVTAIKAYQG